MSKWTPQAMGKKGGLRRTRKKIAAVRQNMLEYHARKRAERAQLTLKLK